MHLDRGPQLKTQIPARGSGSLCKPDCPTLCPVISNLFGLQFGPRVLSPQLWPSLGFTELPFPTLWPGNSRTITGLTTLQRSTSFLWVQDPENCCFLYLVFLPSFLPLLFQMGGRLDPPCIILPKAKSPLVSVFEPGILCNFLMGYFLLWLVG